MAGRYNYLGTKVQEYKSKSIMEIGTWNGQNTRRMTSGAIQSNNLVTAEEKLGVTYYGFDVWELMDQKLMDLEVSKWPPSKSEVEVLLDSTGVTVHLIQGNTHETLPKFVEDNEGLKVDFVFIDGGHSFETIESDWNNIQKIIDKNSVVIFDDYWYPPNGAEPTFGCNRVIDALDRDKWEVVELPVSDTFPLGRVHFVEVKLK